MRAGNLDRLQNWQEVQQIGGSFLSGYVYLSFFQAVSLISVSSRQLGWSECFSLGRERPAAEIAQFQGLFQLYRLLPGFKELPCSMEHLFRTFLILVNFPPRWRVFCFVLFWFWFFFLISQEVTIQQLVGL